MNDSLAIFVTKCLGQWEHLENIESIYKDFYGDYGIEETQNLEDRLQTGL